MFRELVGGQQTEWKGCFLDNLTAFGINAAQRLQPRKGEWHKRRQNKGNGGTFQGEMDRCRESQGWITACSRMLERDGKDQVEDSPKQSCSC